MCSHKLDGSFFSLTPLCGQSCSIVIIPWSAQHGGSAYSASRVLVEMTTNVKSDSR